MAPLGQFVTVTSPVDATVYGKVSRAATATRRPGPLQEKRKAFLVLEITNGVSRYGDVRELAHFLSMELPSVTTVAWIPEDVRGYNVILALACNEIIMHPKAGLGDIGRGKVVERDTQSFVVDLVNRRHNPRVTEGLVLGMMDPQKEVVWVRLKVGDPPVSETRVCSPAEFERLRDNKAVIEDQRTIKAAGTDAIFTGSQARALTIMVTQTAETRADVANIYKLSRESLREDPSAGSALPRPSEFRIEGFIGPMQHEFIIRQMRRSIAAGANLLIFRKSILPAERCTTARNLPMRSRPATPKRSAPSPTSPPGQSVEGRFSHWDATKSTCTRTRFSAMPNRSKRSREAASNTSTKRSSVCCVRTCRAWRSKKDVRRPSAWRWPTKISPFMK